MAWFRVRLTKEEQRIVQEELDCHPNRPIRQRMRALWLLHCGLTREQTAKIVGVGRATVQRWVAAYRDGGLDGLRRWNVEGPQSELMAYRDLIRAMFEERPPRTVAEAAQRIYEKTGLRRGPTQVRKFLKDLGFKWQRARAIPVPPKKVSRNTCNSRRSFSNKSWRRGWKPPKLDKATCSSSTRPISCSARSSVVCGRLPESSCEPPQAGNASTC
jgi:transposase